MCWKIEHQGDGWWSAASWNICGGIHQGKKLYNCTQSDRNYTGTRKDAKHLKQFKQTKFLDYCVSSVLYWAKVIMQLCFILITSLSRACIKPIISPKLKFNQSSILPHNGFNNLFPTVQETNHFMEVGWLKKMKWMVMYQYPTCDVHFVKRKRCVDFWDFFLNSLHF